MKKALLILVPLVVIVVAVVLIGAIEEKKPEPGTVLDEAQEAGRDAASFPPADEDYYADMDNGITKRPQEVRRRLEPYIPGISADAAVDAAVKGRNTWIVWTGGNSRLWDELSRRSFGSLDFLKTLSSHPSMDYGRHNRWKYLGLVNEPCFKAPEGAREDRYGLWLDVREADCPPDPFENTDKYPGVEIGARGENIETGSYYGYASGIVGLRLFPNPEFDAEAESNWDPERYYTDPDYYNNKDLVKPYRVGMSCGFCHVGPNPTNPPDDPEDPEWANLNSNPGAQYFWIDRIFMWDRDTSNFVYQLFHTSRPGALDTSLVSSDQINNPRTMNAVYNLGARLEIAGKWGRETLADGGLNNLQFNDLDSVPSDSPLNDFYEPEDTVWTPRVLKDGADSVGALGALNRVYVNIGLFSEEWLLHFIPLLGGRDITPFKIEVARENSAYWRATEQQTPNTGLFFLASARPDKLADAPGGQEYLTDNQETITRGKEVFAGRCARCHSSKQPQAAFTDHFPNEGCVGPDYLQCWNDYWEWTKTEDYKSQMQEIVNAEDFLENNFLSTDLRIPVSLLETNACSPLATNAIEGDIWNDFSSRSYKDLPSVGTIQVHHPITGDPRDYEMPAGGRGYTRPATLISLWAKAPYLLNNTVGDFYYSGSVEDRVKAFRDGIEKMLWPARRGTERPGARIIDIATKSGKTHPGVIDVTTDTSYLKIDAGFLPGFLEPLTGFLSRWLPHIFGEGGIELGPIPEGTPVNLLTNVNLESKITTLLRLVRKIKKDLKALPDDPTDQQAREVLSNLVDPLLEVSKCPDFVVNRGHYFGTDYLPAAENEPGLSDADKQALIEFLKTF